MRLSAFAFLAMPFMATSAAACCIVEADINGIIALGLDGQTLAIADTDDNRLPISGAIREVSEYWTANTLRIDANGFGVEANFGATLDLTRPATLTFLGFDTEVQRGVPMFEGTEYSMGPRGGALQLTAIVPQDGGYRVRGEFSGQICPEDGASLPCQTLQGRFAFDAESLPATAVTGNLVASTP
jgi:hypothetical protein